MTGSSSCMSCASVSSRSRGRLRSTPFAYRTFSVERRVVEDRHHTSAHHAAEKIVEILDRGGAPPAFALFDGESRRRDVVDVIDQSEQPVDPIDRSPQLVLERSAEQRVRAVERRGASGCAAA